MSTRLPAPSARRGNAHARAHVRAHSYANDSTVAEATTAEASCPFSAVTGLLKQPDRAVLPEKQAEQAGVVPPGPAAFSLASAADVLRIFTSGLHGAMLHFDSRWGPTCRFANPTDLNGASSWVFLNSPENVQHVCMTNVRNYQRRYLPDIYKFATHEKGILGSQDAYNKRHRQMCQPPFRSTRLLRGFAKIVTDRAADAADCLVRAAGGTAERGRGLKVDVALHTQRLTLDVVGLTAFSHDFQQVERMRDELLHNRRAHASQQDRLLWAVNTFGEVLADVFITPLPLLKVMEKLGFTELKRLSEASAVMRESMLDVIARTRRGAREGRVQARRQEIAAAPHTTTDDLLTVLLAARDDDGAPLTDEELWEDIHDVMGAGHETTATTTAAAIYCIAAHPAVEARLRAEIAATLGDRAATYDDLASLPYLAQVIKEVLRLYPAIPVFPREAQHSDVLASGHTVDAGDVVFMSSYALGRSPSLWDAPLEFDPERFSEENAKHIHRFQWMPFGGGPRMCLGAGFAQMTVSLMVVSLMQRLRFRCPEGAPELIPVGYDITMNFGPTDGLHMHAEAL